MSINIVDSKIREDLSRLGFAIIPSFLTKNQIKNLEIFFQETRLNSNVNLPFFTTHWSNNINYRKEVNSFVNEQLKQNLDFYFNYYKCLLGYYLFKARSKDSGVFIHKDWTLIDEEQHVGYNLWMPLIDTNQTNGCFQVVCGSHLDPFLARGSNISQNFNEITEKDIVSIPLNSGDAIVFDQRLLHASPPNLSDIDRLAVGLVIVPQIATPVHYIYDFEKMEAKKYEVGDDFLIKSYYDFQNKEPNDYILKLISKH